MGFWHFIEEHQDIVTSSLLLSMKATPYSEQMYQNELCMFFGNAQAARLVMLQSDPVAMKKIGDRVAKTAVKRKDEWYQKKSQKRYKNSSVSKIL